MSIVRLLVIAALATACTGNGDVVRPHVPEQPLSSKANQPGDPTATWSFPLDDAALNLRSDHLYSDGTSSSYTDGVCHVGTRIFATFASGSNPSGDAILETSAPSKGSCGRLFTVVYPDGLTETLPSAVLVHQLQSPTVAIPIGATVNRRLLFTPSAIRNNPSRCGRLLFGPNGLVAPGSDSVSVTRLDASTWLVSSHAPPDDHAFCESSGSLYEMQVSFVIKSSYPLP